MNANKKARYLVNYFTELLDQSTVSYTNALPKECALKTVNEILNISSKNNLDYWNEVKNQIEYLK